MNRVRIFFLVFGILFLAAPVYAGAVALIPGFYLSQDTEWTMAESPYIIQTTLYIPTGVTLTIDPGVIVKFADRGSFSIEGSLVADGRPDNKIYFADISNDSIGGAPTTGTYISSNGEDSLDNIPSEWGILAYAGSHVSISNAELHDVGGGIDLFGDDSVPQTTSFSYVAVSDIGSYLLAQDANLSLDHVDWSAPLNDYSFVIANDTDARFNTVSIHDGEEGPLVLDSSLTVASSSVSDMFGPAFMIYDNSQLSLVDSSISSISPDSSVDAAVEVYTTSQAAITNTRISDINGPAVQIFGASTLSFSGSSVASSSEGFEIYDTGSLAAIASSTISNIDDTAISITRGALNVTSTVIRNADYGIETLGDAVVTIGQSALSALNQYAAVALGANAISAQGNFWGDPSGPYNANSNPTGLGSPVSDNVDFSNWLSVDPTQTTVQAPTSTPVVSTTTSSTLEPVIIIPGIFGSQEKDGVWILDPILHAYDDLVATLAANGYSTSTASTTLFTFPYDWMNSNVVTAGLLKQKIAEVKVICGCSKVNLVAHSMGGLVARQYIQSDDYQNDVDKVIFLGTPHLGAPEDYLSWEGAVVYSPIFDPASEAMVKILGEYAHHDGYFDLFTYIQNKVPSVQELLPIYPYKIDSTTGGLEAYSSADYPANPFLQNLYATKSLLSRVHIFNIVGDIATSTIGDVVVRSAPESAPMWQDGKPIDSFDATDVFNFVDGDGTVPLSSANDLPIYNSLDSQHTDLPDNAKGIVFKILTGKDLQITEEKPSDINFKFLLFGIFSPIHVLITAPDGKRIGYDPTIGQEVNEIPGAFYSGTTTQNEYVTIPDPEDGQYQVQSTGYADGDYTITASNISDSTTTDASVTGTTSVGEQSSQTFTVSSSTVLSIDTNTINSPQDQKNQPTASVLSGHQHIAGSPVIAPQMNAISSPKPIVAVSAPRLVYEDKDEVSLAKNIVSTTSLRAETASIYETSHTGIFGWIKSALVGIIDEVTSSFSHLINQ